MPQTTLSLATAALGAGFYPIEKSEQSEWVWSQAGTASIRGTAPGRLEYKFTAPCMGTEVRLELNGNLAGVYTSNHDWQDFSGSLSLPEQWSLTFVTNRWNGNGAAFAKDDSREIALLFSTLAVNQNPANAKHKNLKGRICPLPFARQESLRPYTPCCRWFLEEEIHSQAHEADPWNGETARKLRESIYDGSYRFCKRDLCQVPLLGMDELEQAEIPIHADNIKAIRAGQAYMPKGPTSLAISADPRCNLACSTCRSQLITQLSSEDQKEMDALDTLLTEKRDSLQTITFAVNGDVFFSPYLRGHLQKTTREKFPCLKSIEILSNGLLFDQKALDQLRPGSDFIKRVCITVDAGDAETYQRVRGGNWERLVKNLEWMAELRRSGRFEWLRLIFVVRKANYRSLPDFFALAARLQADDVLLSKLQNWTEMKDDFLTEAVCDPRHEEHAGLKGILSSLESRPQSFRIQSNLV
ncbi:MAG: radical SAM protein [Bacteriovoracia bacterium]